MWRVLTALCLSVCQSLCLRARRLCGQGRQQDLPHALCGALQPLGGGEQGRGGDRRGAVGFASVSMSCDSRTPQLVATVGAAAGAKGKKPEAGKGAKGGGAGKQASGAKKSGASSVKEAAQPGGLRSRARG